MSEEQTGIIQETAGNFDWVLQCVGWMLRPIARLCVGRLPYDVCERLFRQMFIDAGREHIENSGRKVTKSSLALITGISYRRIDATGDEENEAVTPSEISPEAAVLERWSKDPMFHGQEERPAALRVYGSGHTFQSLVQRVAGRGVQPAMIMERLMEGGNIEQDEEGRVRLITTVYTPLIASERNDFEICASSWQRLGRAIHHNVQKGPDEPYWLQQDRWTIRVRLDDVPALREELRSLVHTHIKEVENLMEKFEQPVRTAEHAAVGVGWYYWESDTETS